MRERRGKFAGEIRVIARALGDYIEAAFSAGVAVTTTGLNDTSLHGSWRCRKAGHKFRRNWIVSRIFCERRDAKKSNDVLRTYDVP